MIYSKVYRLQLTTGTVSVLYLAMLRFGNICEQISLNKQRTENISISNLSQVLVSVGRYQTNYPINRTQTGRFRDALISRMSVLHFIVT